jgi:hypoxanthine phosphoribosyltransferase
MNWDGEYQDQRSLAEKVADLQEEYHDTGKALQVALDMLKEMIQENIQIRKLACLPKGKYPKELTIRNHTYASFEREDVE